MHSERQNVASVDVASVDLAYGFVRKWIRFNPLRLLDVFTGFSKASGDSDGVRSRLMRRATVEQHEDKRWK
jgi:hypothetical protein